MSVGKVCWRVEDVCDSPCDRRIFSFGVIQGVVHGDFGVTVLSTRVFSLNPEDGGVRVGGNSGRISKREVMRHK
jgi:hypothetical protein